MKRFLYQLLVMLTITTAACLQRPEPALDQDIPVTMINTADPTQPLTLAPSQTPEPTSSSTPWSTDTPIPSRTPRFTPTPTPLPDLVTDYSDGSSYPDIQTSLAFIREQEGKLALFNLEAGNQDPILWLQTAEDVFSPLWSPDGRQLAYLRTGEYMVYQERNFSSELLPADLYLYIAGLESPLESTGEYVISDLIWSPDSTRLAFTGQAVNEDGFPASGKNIYQVSINSQKRQVVIPSELGIVGCSSPAWSPDSAYLAARCRGLMAQGLVGAALDGSNSKYYDLVLDRVIWHPEGSQMLLLNGFYELSLIDSPFPPQSDADVSLNLQNMIETYEYISIVDSRVIGFSWAPDFQNRFLIQGERLIQVFDPDQEISLSVGGDFSRSLGQYSWGPDGNQVALSYFDGNDLEIGVLDLLEGTFYPLTDNQVDDLMPAWQPFQAAE